MPIGSRRSRRPWRRGSIAVLCLTAALLGCKRDPGPPPVDPSTLPESERPIGFEIRSINPQRPGREPNWDERYETIKLEMAEVAQRTFALPPEGSVLEIRLANGDVVKGEFGGLMEGGSARIRVSEAGYFAYNRQRVAPEYRGLFWMRDFWYTLVQQKLQDEMAPFNRSAADFLRQKAEAARAARLAAAQAAPTDSEEPADIAPPLPLESRADRIARLGADPDPEKQAKRQAFIEELKTAGYIRAIQVQDGEVVVNAASRWLTSPLQQQEEIMRTLYDYYTVQADTPLLVRMLHPLTDHEMVRRDHEHGFHRIADLNPESPTIADPDDDADAPATPDEATAP